MVRGCSQRHCFHRSCHHKHRLQELFRPEGHQPIDESPVADPKCSKFGEEMQEFNEYLERAGQRETGNSASLLKDISQAVKVLGLPFSARQIE